MQVNTCWSCNGPIRRRNLVMSLSQHILKVLFIPVICLFVPDISHAFDIGHTVTTFEDSTRSRAIETEVFYPATTSGEDVALAPGLYPVLVFGHGFFMPTSAYENFWTELTPQGYIMLFPRTEAGFDADHEAFGADLAFLVTAMLAENNAPTSRFFGSVDSKVAVMGHSMGGGAAVLATQNNPAITTLVNFAAAETNPSAIDGAQSITTPSLIFSGAEDCVAPMSEHQIPLYQALASTEKTLISILGGGHCYFANADFTCTLGESFCLPEVPISRQDQQTITFEFLGLWLDHFLKNDPGSLEVFNQSLTTSTVVDFMQASPSSITSSPWPVESHDIQISSYPNPFNSHLTITYEGHRSGGLTCQVYDLSGKLVWHRLKAESAETRGTFTWDGRTSAGRLAEGGVFLVKVSGNKAVSSQKVVMLK